MLARRRSAALLRDVSLVSHCSGRELRDIVGLGYEKSFSRGAALTREGEPGESLFLILDGSIGVERNGEQLMVRGPREFIGEIALFSHSPRTATVKAVTDVRTFVIPGRAFRALLGRQPKLQCKVLEALAVRMPED